jgi:Delta3-Delta2-enoyl-CoA isomerase
MASKILSVSYSLNDALATVSLHREPVNSMNTEVWSLLLKALDELEANPKVRAVVFKSALKRNVFTAGNDLLELYAPATSAEKYRNFWIVSNYFLARLYMSPLITIATVKGACPAGGCCMAMCCDFRIVTQDLTMGLNEVALGIAVPPNWVKLMTSIIGQGKADKLLQYARFVGAEEALKVGLVDFVVSEANDLDGTAEKVAQNVLKLPDPGRRVTKLHLRGELGRVWADKTLLAQEAENAWKNLSSPETVGALKGVMDNLSKPKKSGKL